MQAIATAGDDAAVSADARAAALAAISNLSVAELQDLAGAHILFADHAPRDIMVNFLLRQRLATELLEEMGAGSKPYPLQPEKMEVG
jgi:regulator of protease activity HflC (stomatin/prohibitin superfamily)